MPFAHKLTVNIELHRTGHPLRRLWCMFDLQFGADFFDESSLCQQQADAEVDAVVVIYIGHIDKTTLAPSSLLSGIQKMLKLTAIEFADGQKTHALRHTFASHFMINGGNILVFQRILGHSNIRETMRYAHFAPEHLEEVVALNSLNNIENLSLIVFYLTNDSGLLIVFCKMGVGIVKK